MSSEWPYTGHIREWSHETSTGVRRELTERLHVNLASRDAASRHPNGCDISLYARLSAEGVQLEAAIAEAERRDRRRQRILKTVVAQRLYVLMRGLLDAARAGILSRDWREDHWLIRSELEAAATASSVEQADARSLVVHEIVTMPVQAWEPHASGGEWRMALEAWYHARRDAEWRQLAQWRESLPPAWQEAATPPTWGWQSERDELEASYQAGLAAGGDLAGKGWRNRYRAQLSALPETFSEFATKRLRMLDESPERWEMLPAYWLQG